MFAGFHLTPDHGLDPRVLVFQGTREVAEKRGRVKSEKEEAKLKISCCCFSHAPMGKTQKSKGTMSESSEVETAGLFLILQTVRSGFGLGLIEKPKKKTPDFVHSLSLSHP